MRTKKDFQMAVQSLLKKNFEIEKRKSEVKRLCDLHLDLFNSRPAPYELALLTNYLLIDELTDKSKSKSTNNEFPILSNRQINNRKKKEVYDSSTNGLELLMKTSTDSNKLIVSLSIEQVINELKVSDRDKDLLIDWIKAEYNQRELAEKYKMSQQAVSKRLKLIHLKMKPYFEGVV